MAGEAAGKAATNRTSGIIAIKLKDDDRLIDVKQTTGNNSVIIVTKKGKCICFSEKDVRAMGRVAGGVRALTRSEERR